jgi:hypothetical protein
MNGKNGGADMEITRVMFETARDFYRKTVT